MHELSIVMGIVRIAEAEARKSGYDAIDEIELEIGELAGVEMEAFDFAWNQAKRGTMLDKAEKIVHRPEGIARCLGCGQTFRMNNLYDACTCCGSCFSDIIQGREFKVKSITV